MCKISHPRPQERKYKTVYISWKISAVTVLLIQFSCLLSDFSALTRLIIRPFSSEVSGVVARAMAIRHTAITNPALIVLCLELHKSLRQVLPFCLLYIRPPIMHHAQFNKGHLSQIQQKYICDQVLDSCTNTAIFALVHVTDRRFIPNKLYNGCII